MGMNISSETQALKQFPALIGLITPRNFSKRSSVASCTALTGVVVIDSFSTFLEFL